MSEKVRTMAIRVLLVAGTTLSVLGFNFTRQPVFVPLPFLSGVALAVLVIKAPTCTPEEVRIRKRYRRNGVVQLIVSSLILAALITVSALHDWGTWVVVGFCVMEATMVLLAVLAFATLRRTSKKVVRQEECDG